MILPFQFIAIGAIIILSSYLFCNNITRNLIIALHHLTIQLFCCSIIITWFFIKLYKMFKMQYYVYKHNYISNIRLLLCIFRRKYMVYSNDPVNTLKISFKQLLKGL